jgi:hypothetical protein
MRLRHLHFICGVAVLAAVSATAVSLAQVGVVRGAGDAQMNQPADAPAPGQSAPTLEVPPRFVVPPSDAPPSVAKDRARDDSQESAEPTVDPALSGNTGAAAEPKRPYLGLSVQYIQSDAMPGREVRGLEVVGVDAGSPAERAGLRARGTMTKLGATGATAGTLLPPLDLVVMPLLERSGQLGLPGDLIIAVDDQRIGSEADLQDVLDASKPGDTVYFTVVRPLQGGSHETVKVPVKLADSTAAVANAAPSPPSSAKPAGSEKGEPHP